jgi:glycosyltransferase involved in cell wall biosynthesis
VKIAIAHPAVFPVQGYGGTERAIWWLAKGLAERGHSVTLCGLPGSTNPFGDLHITDFSGDWFARLPKADVHHFFFTPPAQPKTPYLVTIEGNAKSGEVFYPNTVFVSANHAERHGGEYFAYNGIDLADYPLQPRNKPYWIFLAKASWRVKNVRGAIRIARKAGVPLDIVGGGIKGLPRFRGTRWRGMQGGLGKLQILQGARGLVFPVLWHEPFGIAVIEALALGAPVVATPFGSLPELVPEQVGVLAKSESELIAGVRACEQIPQEACRRWVEQHFTHHHMAAAYESLYRKVQSQPLHASTLKIAQDQGSMISYS